MKQKIRINTRKLLLEKLGVRSDLLLVAEKLYLNIIVMLSESKDFLNEPDASGEHYRIKISKELRTPLNIREGFSIKKIKIDFLLSSIDKRYTPSDSGLVFLGMGVNTGNKVVKGNEKSPLVFPENTSEELNMSLNLGTSSNIEDLSKHSFFNEFKFIKKEFLSTLAHELKHIFDFSLKPVNMKDKIKYITNTNTFRESEFRSLGMLFYYSYRAHYFEREVYQTEMAKNIQVANITKKEFAEFLKDTHVYKDADNMVKFNFYDVIDPLQKIIGVTYYDLFPTPSPQYLRRRLAGEFDDLSIDTMVHLTNLAKGYKLATGKSDVKTILVDLFDRSKHDDLVFLLVLGGFKIAYDNFHGFATKFIEDFIKERTSKSSNSRTMLLRKQLLQHRDDLVDEVIKDFDIENGPEGLEKALKRMIAEINQVGRETKKKFGKLYAYDELFVDGDQPTKRTTKLPG